jgi:hypothetical protein
LNLNYKETLKDASKNSFTVYFAPSLSNLDKVYQSCNWNQVLSITPDSAVKNAAVSNAIYNPSTGLVEMTVDYQESATGKDLKLQIDYSVMKTSAAVSDPSSASSLSLLSNAVVSVSLKAQNNLALDYYDDSSYSLASTCFMVAQILSGAALLIALVGLLGAKLIGLEMLSVFQISFLAMLSLDEMNPVMDALSGLQYSLGYNKLESYNKHQNLGSEFISIEFNESFIKNYNITSIIILAPILCAIVFKILEKVFNSKGDKTKSEKMAKYFRLSIGEFLLYGFLFSGYLIFLSMTLSVL